MSDMARVTIAAAALDEAIRQFEREVKAAGGYMPAIATRLRIHADELAERYPDDSNAGRHYDRDGYCDNPARGY